ncbi:protein Wiz isoform X3 [Pygocentrus nattereri]|uniref:protein Wiz isoform X3 n=1 Tax=Pygocentrus nattereri TaxID=42514 RepID=UPI00081473BC|nr:protein Wiz isoform X3 [Pygocentrus nattereri]
MRQGDEGTAGMERAPETARKSTASIPLHTVPGTGSSSAAEENESAGVHLCEVCGTCFETKRGLSSHCRSHLRQLGVAVSDSSGAPIGLLYELIRERDGKLPYSSPKASLDKTPAPKPPQKPKIPKSLLTTSLKTLQTPTPKSTQTPTHKTPKASTPKTPPSSTLKTPSSKKDSTTKLKIKIASLVKKYSKSPSAGSAPLSPSLSPPPLSPIKPDKPRKVPTEPKSVPGPVSSPLSPSLNLPSSKPLWAPQETDAPLNLTMTDPSLRHDVHVCELCGAWYETRKGLSSHARAHLRQFGVEIDSKGAPIDILHELLLKEEQSGRVSPLQFDNYPPSSTPPRAAPKRPAPSSPLPEGSHIAPVSPPPLKKIKTSAAAVGAEPEGEAFGQKGDLSKDVSCEFCHENFKKSQSLASHARSHLRQLGITEWSVHGSPMATLRDLMARRGTTSLPKPHAPPSKHSHMPTKPLGSPIKPHAPPTKDGVSPTKPHTSPVQSHVLEKPIDMPTKPQVPPTKHFASPPNPHASPMKTPHPPKKPLPSTPASPPPPSTALPLTSGSTPIAKSPGSAPPRVPKARKGSRTVVPKPKDEPLEKNISVPKPKNTTTPSLAAPGSSSNQNTTVLKPEADLSVPVRCNYCGEMFDSRKALSCHARAHLRQLGVKWSPNASPIDTLYELMLREGTLQGSEVKPEPPAGASGSWRKATSSPQTFTTSPVEFLAEKTDSQDSMATGCEATCDLCGFDFENRKALASHARAHLRQQGVDWHTNGSPIETLAEWMQREPGKVAELHKRYMRGELPQVVKKRSSASPHPSLSDPESARPATARELKGQLSSSSAHRKPSASQHTPTHTAARGCERRPPKHIPHSDSRLGAGPLKPRVGNAPSLMPRPPESSLVKLVGKVYSLKCRFCEEVFKGPLSVQEDWLIHLRQHILNLKRDSAPNSAPATQSTAPAMQSTSPTIQRSDSTQLIGPQVV